MVNQETTFSCCSSRRSARMRSMSAGAPLASRAKPSTKAGDQGSFSSRRKARIEISRCLARRYSKWVIEVSPGFAPGTFTLTGRGSAGKEPYRQAKMPT